MYSHKIFVTLCYSSLALYFVSGFISMWISAKSDGFKFIWYQGFFFSLSQVSLPDTWVNSLEPNDFHSFACLSAIYHFCHYDAAYCFFGIVVTAFTNRTDNFTLAVCHIYMESAKLLLFSVHVIKKTNANMIFECRHIITAGLVPSLASVQPGTLMATLYS